MAGNKNLTDKVLTSPSPLFVWSNPGIILDRNGFLIDITGNKWRLHNFLQIIWLDWNKVTVSEDLKDSIKIFIVHCIESLSPCSVKNYYKDIRYFFSKIPLFCSIRDITYSLMETAFTKISNEGKAHRFFNVRAWYRWCYNQNILGFKEEVLKRLEAIKIKSLKSHIPVMTRDPNKGPLTDLEYNLIVNAVREQKGELLDRICVMLLLELGSRPYELALLKEGDFKITYSPSNQKFFSLDIPRIKQKVVNGFERKRRSISSTLGQAIERLIEENHQRYGSYGPEMALLCRKQVNQSKLPEAIKESYSLHVTTQILKTCISNFAKSANLISPRTKKLIHLSPYRFRYTLATKLADQGTPSVIIAELLGHSKISSVNVYVASTSNAVTRLNESLEKENPYNNVINLFLGKIVNKSEKEDPSTVIPGITPTMKNLGGIGKCGANQLCKLYPPISCYICPQFIAWKDGPHEQMLSELEGYIEFLRKKSGNPSDRISSQLNEVIIAIRTVVAIIKQ